MTGFAQVRRSTTVGELTISLRGVNHRGLDLQFHLQSELLIFENDIRAALKRDIARGHIEIRGSLQRTETSQGAPYNRAALARYISAFRHAAAEYGFNQNPDLNVALAQQDIWQDGSETAVDERLAPDVQSALDACLAAFNEQREREGAALMNELLRESRSIEQGAQEIAGIRAAAFPLFQERLRERLNELLGQSTISEARLAEEAALLASRSDIQEELARLGIHTAELQKMLAGGGELGKRLDFLLQEMNRETNTILSKTSGIGDAGVTVTRHALAIKGHIEKIREQALNIE